MKIDAQAIKAECRNVYDAPLLDGEIQWVQGNMHLSYEAALILWDMTRWPHNRVIIRLSKERHPGDGIRCTITMLRRTIQITGPRQDKAKWPAKIKWLSWHVYLYDNDFVDPMLFYSSMNAKQFLATVLDDVINRPEPLRVHDTKNFEWIQKERILRKFR